jgi:hypothetical protein
MSALTVVGEQSHVADYLAPPVLFAEYEIRQHWGSRDGNYVVDGRNFVVLEGRVDYEAASIAVSAVEHQPVPEPGTAALLGVALMAAAIWRMR